MITFLASLVLVLAAPLAVHTNPLFSRTPSLERADASLTPSLLHGPTADSSIPQLYVCSTANCASCTAILLENLGEGNCFYIGDFISVGVVNPDNTYHLPVDIAPANCQNWLEIPEDNVCYNINGGPFTQYGEGDSVST